MSKRKYKKNKLVKGALKPLHIQSPKVPFHFRFRVVYICVFILCGIKSIDNIVFLKEYSRIVSEICI